MRAKIQFVCAVLVYLYSAFSHAAFVDKTITIDKNLIIATTFDNSQTVKAAVLMVPGWTAPIDSVGNIYKDLAFDLAAQGIASLRTNIRGESERELTNYTLTNTYAERVRDSQLALDKMRSLYPDVPIGIVGHSLGGSTTLSLLANKNNITKSVALWSMAGQPDKLFPRVLDNKEQETLLKDGSIVITRWADITVTERHFKGMNSANLYPPLKSYTGPFMHIVGSDEPRHEEMNVLFESLGSEIKEDITIHGADHIYNVFEPNKPYAARVRAITTHWFTDTLLN